MLRGGYIGGQVEWDGYTEGQVGYDGYTEGLVGCMFVALMFIMHKSQPVAPAPPVSRCRALGPRRSGCGQQMQQWLWQGRLLASRHSPRFPRERRKQSNQWGAFLIITIMMYHIMEMSTIYYGPYTIQRKIRIV